MGTQIITQPQTFKNASTVMGAAAGNASVAGLTVYGAISASGTVFGSVPLSGLQSSGASNGQALVYSVSANAWQPGSVVGTGGSMVAPVVTRYVFTSAVTAFAIDGFTNTTASNYQLFLDGVCQVPVTDYSLSATSTGGNMLLTTAPTSGVVANVFAYQSTIAAASGLAPISNDFTGNGTVSAYTINGYTNDLAESYLVHVGGLYQRPGVDYNASPAGKITFTTPPPNGASVMVLAYQTGPSYLPQVSGSSVSFQQTGAGAVARNMQDKARESVSVKDFGAVGDGVTDDTAAIQAAVSASNNVVVPSGNYRITSTITVPANSSVHFQSGAYTSGSGSISGGSIFKQSGSGAATRSQAAAVSGSVMGIEGIIEETEYPLTVEAGIWPGGKTYAFQAISKTFDSSYATAPDLSPTAGLFVFANNKNAPGDVVGVLSDVVARTNDDKVWGANFIARNDSGTTNTKLIGLEIDVEPIVGTTVSSQSIGLSLNIFSLSTSIPAIQIGGIGGGFWGNGIIVAKVTGAGIAAQSGSTMGSLADASQGTYTDCAIRLGEGVSRSIVFGNNTFGLSPYLYGDSFGNLVANLGSMAFILQGLLVAPNLPTSAAGLPSGGVWRNGAVLNIVP